MNALLKNKLDNPITPYLILLGLTVGYSLVAPQGECLEFFDCNSYIAMVDKLSYSPDVAPHHAMRILPPLLVRGLMAIGLDMEMGFRLLSSLAYIIFGGGFYYCLVHLLKKKLNDTVLLRYAALAFTLITLCCDHTMIAALVFVYQTNDALTYPLGLGILYFTLQRQPFAVLCLSAIGIFNRQCLFPFGLFSLLYLAITPPRQKMALFYGAVLIGLYQGLIHYFHAEKALSYILTPAPGFFEPQNLLQILIDSQLILLVIPLLPFMLLTIKELFQFYSRNWFLLFYCAITIGQPFISYHLTGNNFNRIALQGVWPFYFVTAYVFIQKYADRLNATWIGALMAYATLLALIMGLGTTYGPWIRVSLMLAMATPLASLLYFQKRREGSSQSY